MIDQHLADQRFLAGDEPTLADCHAIYTYTAHAPRAVSLDPYANLRAWLARVEALPGFVPMKKALP